MRKNNTLPASKLQFTCKKNMLNFKTTADITLPEIMIGQDRAVKAVEFGLYNKVNGYNIYVSGLVGTGKVTYAQAAVKRVADKEKVPEDWCYVNNFDNNAQPVALSLPAGTGSVLRDDMQELVRNLKHEIPKMFAGDAYEEKKNELMKKFQTKRNEIMEEFNRQAEELGITPQWTNNGFVGVPNKDGSPITPEDFQKLEAEEREEYEAKLMTVHEKAVEAVRLIQQLEREAREELKELDAQSGLKVVEFCMNGLREKYREQGKVVAYLEGVSKDVVKNIHDFKPSSADEENNPFAMFKKSPSVGIQEKCHVNLLIDNSATKGAPVVIETNPTYYNLIGRVEYESRMGVVNTDFSMIKAGALHRANGGYLILYIKDLLTNWGAWEALKRTLKTQKLAIENLGEQYGMLALATLKPQPIPLKVKIILIGSPQLYHLLVQHDEDFRKLFRIYADFDIEMNNNKENIGKLAGFIASSVQKDGLKHFDRDAVAKIVEYSTRLSGKQDKLTTCFSDIVEVLCEADAWASMDNKEIVCAEHVVRAIAEKRYRNNKYEEKIHDMFLQGKYLLDTDTEKIGQVNGLAVLSVGEYAFGKPSRITANTYAGRSGIINIERETKMSGTSHSKGVLTLSSFLGATYAQKRPLSMTASITFEQLYEGVDGDSASSAELYAILSSLADAPIRQYIAVTGSVNQKGEIQPVGGVTEKIEGFFAVCKLKGLTGTQGVIIPWQNTNNLTLSDEVVAAVAAGQFHIYPVKTVDEGIEILTGISAGKPGKSGTYTRGSIHQRVQAKLEQYSGNEKNKREKANTKGKTADDEE